MINTTKKWSFLFSLLLFCSQFNVHSQSIGDYRTNQSGNWNQTSTWQRWNGSNWITPASSTPDNTDGAITIRSSDIVTVTANVTVGEVTINSGCQVIVNPSVTLTIANDIPLYDFTINGTLLNKGTINFSGIGSMYVGSGGTYIHNTISGAGTVLDATSLSNTSTWIYRGSGTLQPSVAFSGRNYGHLHFESTSGSWSINPNASNPSSCNDFYVGTGVTINNNNNALFTVEGDFTINGTINTGSGKQSYLLNGVNKAIDGYGLNTFFDELTIGPSASYTVYQDIHTSGSADFIVEGTLDLPDPSTNFCRLIGNGGSSTFTLASGATLKAGSRNGIAVSIMDFGITNYHAGANYEFNMIGESPISPVFNTYDVQTADLPNDTVNNLKVNVVNTYGEEIFLNLINPALTINGSLNLNRGTFGIGASIINFNGPPIIGPDYDIFLGRYLSNIYTSNTTTLRFQGAAPGCFIPATVSIIGKLEIDKSANDLALNGFVEVGELSLINGKIITGNGALYCSDTATSPGNANSYVNGKLTLTSGSGTKTLFYPVGKNQYQPITINNINYSSGTYNAIQIECFETIPAGTPDGTTLYPEMHDRYWTLRKIHAANNITSIGSISIAPTSAYPSLTASSKTGFSLNDSALSYTSIGGSLVSSTLTSTIALSSAQITDLGSANGSFIGIGQCTYSNAGNDATACASYMLTGGSIPLGGTGTWSVLSGSGTFSPNPNTANATVSGLSNGINSFRWMITTAQGCSASDTVIITKVVPVWYEDNDGDSYGKSSVIQSSCTQPFNYSSVAGDCDDSNPGIHPNVTEMPGDGIDQNCDTQELCYLDTDDDNYGTAATIVSTNLVCTDVNEAAVSGDCNGANPSIHPGASEIPADGVDQDCNFQELCYTDNDNDDFGTSVTVSSPNLVCTDANEASVSGDCNDLSAGVHPGAVELCNTIDDNCNGLSDEYCPTSLNLKMFIQGYYIGSGGMIAVIDPVNHPLLCDTITIELHETIAPFDFVESVSMPIDLYGNGVFTFPQSRHQSYYLVIRHRNSIETWSKNPMLFDTAIKIFDLSQH